MHYSMVLLPEKPMQARLFDDRVGYFSVRNLDYGRDEHRSPQRRYITRWRLEKKDPNAALSDPGLFVFAHTVNEATDWRDLRERGVDGIYTDLLIEAGRD